MGRKAAAALLIGALIAGLTGCTLSDPPSELVAAAEQYAEEVRALPGVQAAQVSVTNVGYSDDSDEWQVSIVIDAKTADGLGSVPGAVAAIRPPSGAASTVVLRFPAAPGVASVVVSDATAADIAQAATLRELPVAASVTFFGDFSVELVDGTGLLEAASAIRESQVLTKDTFDLVRLAYAGQRVAVDVSLTGPSDELIALIERLEADSTVQHIYSSEPRLGRPRPRINVDSDDSARIADVLTQLDETILAPRPRTAFTASGDDVYIDGFVGLPLGSSEPDDLPVEPTAAPIDPAVIAAQVAEDTVSVTEFLAVTVESSGIPGTAEVFVTSCTLSETASQAQGALLLKVFDYADSAQPAYDAIVAAWEADGYQHTDQATGTSIYTNEATPVVELDIRGTSEGIRISAFGECRG